MSALKLCVLTSEMMPYAKTGGLADVTGALVGELGKLGHDVRAFMPLHAVVRSGRSFRPVAAVQAVPMTIGAARYEFSLQQARLPDPDVLVYFVDCPELFDRASLYTTDPDEHRRFLLFTRAVIESCQRIGFAPDVFHCHDWHAALLPLLLKTTYRPDRFFAASRSVLTIHNIGYQGVMSSSALGDLGAAGDAALLDAGDLANGVINPLKNGIKWADAVTTVSPTYAREILTTDLGMGMQSTLAERRDEVVGILNGVDYRDWDPRHDVHLSVHFGPGDLVGKARNKATLLAALDLSLGAGVPLISMVSRLAEQKGFDLLFEVLPEVLEARDCGFVLLGSGEARYSDFFAALARRFPARVAFRPGYDEALAHRIEAGSDIFLMPSHYEPCGLNQMYSLRYGTVPVVHRTGGLADSVQHFDAATRTGTGCVFNDYDPPAVRWALNTTLDWYTDPALWTALMLNGMAMDFSWGRQVAQYVALFERLAGRQSVADSSTA
jgi:starch synthase